MYQNHSTPVTISLWMPMVAVSTVPPYNLWALGFSLKKDQMRCGGPFSRWRRSGGLVISTSMFMSKISRMLVLSLEQNRLYRTKYMSSNHCELHCSLISPIFFSLKAKSVALVRSWCFAVSSRSRSPSVGKWLSINMPASLNDIDCSSCIRMLNCSWMIR